MVTKLFVTNAKTVILNTTPDATKIYTASNMTQKTCYVATVVKQSRDLHMGVFMLKTVEHVTQCLNDRLLYKS